MLPGVFECDLRMQSDNDKSSYSLLHFSDLNYLFSFKQTHKKMFIHPFVRLLRHFSCIILYSLIFMYIVCHARILIISTSASFLLLLLLPSSPRAPPKLSDTFGKCSATSSQNALNAI